MVGWSRRRVNPSSKRSAIAKRLVRIDGIDPTVVPHWLTQFVNTVERRANASIAGLVGFEWPYAPRRSARSASNVTSTTLQPGHDGCDGVLPHPTRIPRRIDQTHRARTRMERESTAKGAMAAPLASVPGIEAALRTSGEA